MQCIWQGLLSSVDWSARPDQIEGLALREVGVCADLLGFLTRLTLLDVIPEIRTSPSAVLPGPQERGSPHQRRPDLLLRRYPHHQGVPPDLEGVSLLPKWFLFGIRREMAQVLYNKDCISDQAIIYWHQKGSKPQGRHHFLKATEPLVKVRYAVFVK